MDHLRNNYLIEIHHCCKFNEFDSDDEVDSDNEEILERDKQILKLMMSNEYPD